MLIDLKALRQSTVSLLPYPHVVTKNFVPATAAPEITRDFPELSGSGLFVAEDAASGPAMAELLRELASDDMRAAVGTALGLDLTGRPPFVTLRGFCAARDGRIHADSHFKLATVLVYLNAPWAEDGGRLRILNSSEDIEDYAAEVPPDFGTLVAFRVQENSWHGHKPFAGQRRYVMVNYCATQELRDSEMQRHRFSARVKSVTRKFSLEKA